MNSSSPTHAPSRRTPMACSTCRQRKVKCIPNDARPERTCNRCNVKNLTCQYMSISEEESLRSRTSPSGPILWPRLDIASPSMPLIIQNDILPFTLPPYPNEIQDLIDSRPPGTPHEHPLYSGPGELPHPTIRSDFLQQNYFISSTASYYEADLWWGQGSCLPHYSLDNNTVDTIGDIQRPPLYHINHRNVPPLGAVYPHHDANYYPHPGQMDGRGY